MDIGSKIKRARMAARITQEQAAEALGISRQTLSNWENEKSSPDIASVLKMSALYGDSLDSLLKGVASMTGYLHYIEESTNIVKSRTSFSKLILILSYLIVWGSVFAVSWQFSLGNMTEALAGPIQWLVLPVTTLIISGFIGYRNYWGKRKWFALIGFGLMFSLSVHMGHGMRESPSFHLLEPQTVTLVFIGAFASLLGMTGGHLLRLELSIKRRLLRHFEGESSSEDAE